VVISAACADLRAGGPVEGPPIGSADFNRSTRASTVVITPDAPGSVKATVGKDDVKVGLGGPEVQRQECGYRLRRLRGDEIPRRERQARECEAALSIDEELDRDQAEGR
jgi:hypothetical protein